MKGHLYNFGPFQLDTEEKVLRRDGEPLPLKPKVFDLLVVLVENSGRVVCKDELMKQVWADSFVEEGNLAISVVKLRQALGEAHNERQYIETVPRRGYRFVTCIAEEWKEKADLAGKASSPMLSSDAYAVAGREAIAG